MISCRRVDARVVVREVKGRKSRRERAKAWMSDISDDMMRRREREEMGLFASFLDDFDVSRME